ncbi:MAG: proton-conducting membrane transporter, partial [Lachnospiraceae bacterium]|nr:proton-conducting membrane transporter [Lachnospiraceae bacterium]
MSGFLILLTIFLPLFGGFAIVLTPIKSRKAVLGLSLSIMVIAAVLAWILILNPPANSVILFRFIDRFSIAFKIDGMSKVFAGLISSLWPFAVLYSFEYMEHEANEN